MKNIQSKLMVNFIVLTFIPIIAVGLFSYANFTSSMKKDLGDAVLNSLEQVSKNLDDRFTMIESFLNVTLANEFFQNAFQGTRGEVWDNQRQLMKIVMNYIYFMFNPSFEDSNGIALYYFGEEGGVFLYNSVDYDIKKEEWENYQWYKETVEMDGRINWIGTIYNPDTKSRVEEVFIAGRVVKQAGTEGGKKAGTKIGDIFLAVDENILKSIYNSVEIDQSGEIIITDKRGQIISRAGGKTAGSSISRYGFSETILEDQYGYLESEVDGVDSMVVYYTSPKTGYKVISVVPYDGFAGELKNVTILTVFILMCCMVLFFAISYIISKNIALPIQNLRKAMAKVEKGNFDVSVKENYTGEVGQMVLSFNYMVERLKEFFSKSIREERLKRDMEIKALQYQVNPHFLYNILGAIRLKAIVDGSEEVGEMLHSLSRLLNRTIGKTGMMIPVRLEIQNLNDYLKIQRICYGEEMEADINIEREIMDFIIPNLLLQPIVENAVFHGLAKRKGDGFVRITGKRVEEDLVFEIYDNGAGMDEKQIEMALTSHEYRKDGFTRIGIRNVNDRIKLNYGDNYGVMIESRLGEWTLVRLRIPAVRGCEDDGKDEDFAGR